MPFTYQHYTNPLIGSIAATMQQGPQAQAVAAERIAQAQAGAIQARGNAWADVGHTIAQIPQQIQQQQDMTQRRSLQQSQIDENTAQTAARQRAAQGDALLGKLHQQFGDDYDKVASGLADAGFADEALKYRKSGMEMLPYRQNVQKELAKAVVAASKDAKSPEEVLLNLDHFVIGDGPITQKQRDQVAATLQTVQTPEDFTAWQKRTFDWGDSVIGPKTLKAGDVEVGGASGRPITTVPKTITNRAELAIDAANPNSPTHEQSAAALKLDKPPVAPPKGSLDEQLLEAFKTGDTQTAKTITDTMTAAAKAKGDPAAVAATERQIAAINAQANQQKRSQDFEVLKTARAEVEKANVAYTTARTSADTLRDVVTSAKAGNKVAGSLQALEATMSAIRGQGLNRINTAEIGVTANAGSMYDRISGWLGKKIEGQPVPPDIQKDMLEFADILQKAAYKKYNDTHSGVNKLYGTSIPPTFSEPVTGTAPPALTPGLSGVASRP